MTMKRKPNDTTGLSTRLASVLDAVTAEAGGHSLNELPDAGTAGSRPSRG